MRVVSDPRPFQEGSVTTLSKRSGADKSRSRGAGEDIAKAKQREKREIRSAKFHFPFRRKKAGERKLNGDNREGGSEQCNDYK